MATLLSLVDHTKTDKESRHNYLTVYEKLFSPIKETVKTVLEIGIDKGGSIELWRQYFLQAEITGIELQPDTVFLQEDRLHLSFNTNAYTMQTVDSLQGSFDILIDDGSHILQDLLFVLQVYSCKLTKTGILILEDICCDSWRQALLQATPVTFTGEFIDCRDFNGNYDSVLYIVKRKIYPE